MAKKQVVGQLADIGAGEKLAGLCLKMVLFKGLGGFLSRNYHTHQAKDFDGLTLTIGLYPARK